MSLTMTDELQFLHIKKKSNLQQHNLRIWLRNRHHSSKISSSGVRRVLALPYLGQHLLGMPQTYYMFHDSNGN